MDEKSRGEIDKILEEVAEWGSSHAQGDYHPLSFGQYKKIWINQIEALFTTRLEEQAEEIKRDILIFDDELLHTLAGDKEFRKMVTGKWLEKLGKTSGKRG